jgi:hypothetical protein
LNSPESFRPTKIVVTIRSQFDEKLTLKSCRIWLPKDNDSYQTLFPADTFDFEPADGAKTWSGDTSVPAKDLMGITLSTDPLPLTFMALEVVLERESNADPLRLWSSMKIRPSTFDISGGWTG